MAERIELWRRTGWRLRSGIQIHPPVESHYTSIRIPHRWSLAVPNQHLPTKSCAHCKRDFAWRKKWERDWEQVKYCSKKCAAAMKPKRLA